MIQRDISPLHQYSPPSPTCSDARSEARRAGLALCVLLLAVLFFFSHAQASAPLPEPSAIPVFQPANEERAAQPLLTDRKRYGFVILSGRWPDLFDVAQLGAGWYADYTLPLCRKSPGGMDRALGISTDTMAIPGGLRDAIDNHPGTTWLIGNEPDCINQDSLTPSQYADIYHDLYYFIKQRDPSALIAAGGIVQPTPVRLAWLDAVLAAYQAIYEEAMPVDVWHIHNMILNERQGEWGCDIPPGMDPTLGLTRTIDQNDDMDIFVQQIIDFRQWMADRGYAGYPLLVTEYGVLMPVEFGFDPPRVNAFMSASFEYMASATDAELGDPADGNRLVQRWAWYSLDDRLYTPISGGFNGNLFNPDTHQITVFGQHFASLTASLPPLSYIDLAPGRQLVVPAPVLPGPTGTLTVPLQIEIENLGTLPAGTFSLTLDYSGAAAGTAEVLVDGVGAQSMRWITITFPALPVGGYRFTGQIDAARQLTESIECNNSLGGGMVVPTTRLTLPAIAQQNAGLTRALAPTDRDNQPVPGFQEWPVLTPGSQPGQIAVDRTDGTIWFTEWQSSQLGHFDPATETFVEYPISPTIASQPWGLAIDAAGRVWFAETAGNKIGRFDPDTETFTEYGGLTPQAEPWDVALESSGIIWFTERAANKIGRLDPATGDVTEYSLPTANAQPAGLALQRVGTNRTWVWFVETAASKLGRLDWNDGAVQIYERITPTRNSAPQDVTLNAMHFPWFTESQTNNIAVFYVTTIGAIREFPVPTLASEPYGIAMDTDGVSVWFTERAGNKLGWWNGLFSEYTLPTADSLPTSIAVDAAGCAWYAAPGSSRIGRLCVERSSTFLPVIFKRHQAGGRE